jgi:hypothetical protein
MRVVQRHDLDIKIRTELYHHVIRPREKGGGLGDKGCGLSEAKEVHLPLQLSDLNSTLIFS